MKLAAVLVVAALAAAGAIVAVVRYGIYGHVVPRIVGDNVPTARAVARNAGLSLVIGGYRYSLSIPGGDVLAQSLRAGMRERAGTVIIVTESKGPRPVAVPDVEGWTLGRASEAITRDHLVPVVSREWSSAVDSGLVVTQDPSAGAGTRARGSKVVLYVSKGPQPRIVPDVVGLPVAEAVTDLTNDQLGWKRAPGAYSTTVKAGYVISENPPASSSERPGTPVALTVSLGPPFVTVPSVTGEPASTAAHQLEALGLQVAVYGPQQGRFVVYTDPGAGASIRVGSTVYLYVV